MTAISDEALAKTALALAKVFAAGGRLLVTAPGRQDHARHMAVEFVHPAIAGARSLPALALQAADLAAMRADDDAVVLIESAAAGPSDAPAGRLVLRAPDHVSESGLVRWYHVLWELVQVSLEHPGLSGGSASVGGDSTGFLYPFLDAAETDEAGLLDSMASSVATKVIESERLGTETLSTNADSLAAAATDISTRVAAGGRAFTIGNGGSACDAAQFARLASAAGVPTTCLASDAAVLSALANDLGAEHIFARQVEAHVRPGDIVIAFSTSGASPNLVRAFDALPTGAGAIACAGYGGGPMAQHGRVDHALVVSSGSIHRIQEAQSRLIENLLERVNKPARVNA